MIWASGQTTNRSLSVGETNGVAAVPSLADRVSPDLVRQAVTPSNELVAVKATYSEQVKVLLDTAEVLQLQLEEMKIAFRKVVGDNAEMKIQLQEKEKTVQLLTQNLAVWKTEAELFQHKWEEANLEAKASGVKLMTEGEQRLQKQLSESIRQLYDTQQERERLREQLLRLIEVTGLVLAKSSDLDPQLKRMAEVQRDAALEAAQELKIEPELLATNRTAEVTQPGSEMGKIIDVNKELQLVVMSFGRVNGVVIGMPFLVMQGNVVIAQVKVVDVREKISGALIERAEKSVMIEVGDRVKLNTEK
ncbi:MAG: hypothetical protein EXS18_02765 [Verrucomicrobiae bacterium]|nr:hypothetical protein [Verrucomicrobiae bacterium]